MNPQSTDETECSAISLAAATKNVLAFLKIELNATPEQEPRPPRLKHSETLQADENVNFL